MLQAVPEKPQERVKSQIPWGRFGRPDDAARVVHFLASDYSSFTSGSVYDVNGGQGMQAARVARALLCCWHEHLAAAPIFPAPLGCQGAPALPALAPASAGTDLAVPQDEERDSRGTVLLSANAEVLVVSAAAAAAIAGRAAALPCTKISSAADDFQNCQTLGQRSTRGCPKSSEARASMATNTSSPATASPGNRQSRSSQPRSAAPAACTGRAAPR